MKKPFNVVVIKNAALKEYDRINPKINQTYRGRIDMYNDSLNITDHEKQHGQFVFNRLNAAVFEWNLKTGEIYRSPAYYRYALSRISNEDILNNCGLSDVVYKDDLPLLLSFFADVHSKKKKTETTLRAKMTSGSYHLCRMIGYFFDDGNGAPARMVGIILDINNDGGEKAITDEFLNEIPCGIAVFKAGEKPECLYFSDGFAEISGRTRSEIENLIEKEELIDTVILPCDRHFLPDAMSEASEGKHLIDKICRCITKDGSCRWLHLNGTKICDDCGIRLYCCLFTAASDEMSYFRSIVEDSAVGILVAERKTRRVIYMNDMLCSIYGIPAKTVNAESKFTDIVENKRLLLTQSEVDELASDKYSEFHVTYDRDVYLCIRGKALNWNGLDAYILYVTDESEQRERQMRFQGLIDSIPGGVGIFDIYGGKAHMFYINNSYYELLGDRRENRIYKKDTEFFRNIHPDDHPALNKAVADLAGGCESISFDYRAINADNGYTWIHLVAKTVNRDKDKTTVYCCFTDISEVVIVKEKLERTNSVIKMQYAQELERRKILEKGSYVNICINITKEKVTALNCIDNRFENLPDEFDCVRALDIMLEKIPISEDRIAVEKAMNCKNMLELFRSGITGNSVEYRSRQPDGSLHWIRVVYDMMEDRQSEDIICYVYYYDIDSEKKSQLTLNSVVDEEIDYVILYTVSTETARFVHVNEDLSEPIKGNFKLCELFSTEGYKSIEEDDRAAIDGFFNKNNLIDGLLGAQVVTATFRKIMSDGSVRRKKLRAFYLDDTHEDIVIARRDITDIYEEEQQQKQVLQAAASEAIRANRAKSDFLSRISHDMRTPMNGILGIAALMRDKTSLTEIKKDLSQLEMSGQYLLRLINDTLDMNKIEAGKLKLHPEPVNGAQLAQNILANAFLMAREENVKLDTHIPEVDIHTCPMVWTDPARLEQIVMNVVSNAIKFTPSGGTVTLIIECISMADDMITERYIVRDSGIGMSKDFLPHLFEPFAQEGRMNTDGESGTGLGMAIVKQLVELMDGEITVKSKENEGTEITLIMRYRIFHGEIADNRNETVNIGILDGKRVLLCEDHPLNAHISMQQLQKKGIIAEHAENGKLGVDMFENSEPGYYDAILMDIRMPVMDGLLASAAIRALDRRDAKQIPIIAMTANAYDEDVKKSFEVGMNAHLAKPIQPELLYETLTKFINTNRK